jgi:hypothetical protein
MVAGGAGGAPDHCDELHVLVTYEGAMNALSREGCRHYEVFDQADENFEREIFKVEDPVVKQSAGALFDRMWGPNR